MKTYFIRHTGQLDIDQETFEKILQNNLIAIHFPFKRSRSERTDSTSIDPADYHLKNHKEAIKTFSKLAQEGGYICAEYRSKDGAYVGKIKKGTKIKLFKGRWGDLNKQQGRVAILKTLPLKKVQYIPPSKYLVISSGRPRQGTIKAWKNIGDRIKCIVEKIPLTPILSNLSPPQQEVLCSEYLRGGLDPIKILPVIKSLLLPVGRTLIDVDIVGLDNKGHLIYVQVTYNKFEKSKEKFEGLKKYLSSQSKAVLFCRDSRPKLVDGIVIYPLEMAFDIYTKTGIGKKWLKEIFH